MQSTEKKTAQPHPFVDGLLRNLSHDGAEPLNFAPNQIQQFVAAVTKMSDGETIYKIVHDIMWLANVLSGKGSTVAAQTLLDSSEPIFAHLETQAAADVNLHNQRVDDLRTSVKQQQQALRKPSGVAGAFAPSAGGVGFKKNK